MVSFFFPPPSLCGKGIMHKIVLNELLYKDRYIISRP